MGQDERRRWRDRQQRIPTIHYRLGKTTQPAYTRAEKNSVDIEVESEEGIMPNPRDYDRAVIAVGFVGSDGLKESLC